MIDVTVTPDVKTLERLLGPVFARQARFAIALGLTRTAEDAQTRIRALLPTVFTLRSKWVTRGIQRTRATKSTLTSEVGSRSDFMDLHATGGRKEGKGKGVAVPVIGGARRTKAAKTTRSRWPGAMLKRTKFFVQTVRGKRGVWKRQTKKRHPIRLQWSLEPEVEIKPTWPFERQAQNAVAKSWAVQISKALDKAISTARTSR